MSHILSVDDSELSMQRDPQAVLSQSG